MKFVISIILLSLFACAFAKKSFGHKTHKEKIYGNNEELNERQFAKQQYYRSKHFDHISREHLEQLAKHFPIAVSEHDIKLQADVIDDTRKPHHYSDPHLTLQRIDAHHNSKQRNTEHKKRESSKRIDDLSEKHDKHNAMHKKHEMSANDNNEHKHKKYRNEDKSREVDRVYGTHHLSADFENAKHEKHQKKDKHHKKNKKDISKKYKKSYSKYY